MIYVLSLIVTRMRCAVFLHSLTMLFGDRKNTRPIKMYQQYPKIFIGRFSLGNLWAFGLTLSNLSKSHKINTLKSRK